MTFVVIENCKECMYTDCVEVCPVDCFYGDKETEKMLYIHPDECIDCGACVPVCPVQAIFAEDETPEDQKSWIQINADKCADGTLENVTENLGALPTAEEKKQRLGLQYIVYEI